MGWSTSGVSLCERKRERVRPMTPRVQSRQHGVGPSGVSPCGRKRDAVVRGELEHRSRRSDVRALAVLEKKLPL